MKSYTEFRSYTDMRTFMRQKTHYLEKFVNTKQRQAALCKKKLRKLRKIEKQERERIQCLLQTSMDGQLFKMDIGFTTESLSRRMAMCVSPNAGKLIQERL